VFMVVRITCMYWPIECTPKPWFVKLFEVVRIAYMY
jgi:hypothetical protein